MSNSISSLEPEKQSNQAPNTDYKETIDMGLTFALGPFPDEPILSAIEKAVLLSSRFQACSKEAPKKLLNSSFGTDCPVQKLSLSKLPNVSISCPDLTISSEETLKEKLDFTSKASSQSELVVGQCPVSNDKLNRMWVEKKTTASGIECYEIWSGEGCKDSPSMIFILSPSGEVIPFEYSKTE